MFESVDVYVQAERPWTDFSIVWLRRHLPSVLKPSRVQEDGHPKSEKELSRQHEKV
jgi:hypothetical protein